MGADVIYDQMFDFWTTIVLGIVVFTFFFILGMLDVKGHISAKIEQISVKYMSVYAKRNYEVQEKILRELKEIKSIMIKNEKN
ncbi:hypothetical protein GF386_00895 [Candidatus Pacearchaeota archaeon]|nr:hypothetical protein [Candidatus Pacearchaeota archaeon]